jgi:hypothetical protein
MTDSPDTMNPCGFRLGVSFTQKERAMHTMNRRALVAGAASALPTIAALPPAAAALTLEADPIFAAIEAHRQAYTAIVADLRRHSALEEELPQEKRQTFIHAHEEKIIETDDPRWIAAERALSDGWNVIEDAGCDLVNIEPTSVAGVVALLHYVADQEAAKMAPGFLVFSRMKTTPH